MYMFVFEVVTVYIICSHATCKGEDVFLTRVVPSSLVCASLCAYTTRCGSYTWDAATRSCHLHTQGDTGTEAMPHAKYWKESQGMVCRDRPCKENEVCVPVEAGTNYVCVASTTATTTTTTTSTTTLSTTRPATTTTNTNPSQITSTTTTTTTTTTLSTTPSATTTTNTTQPQTTTTTTTTTTLSMSPSVTTTTTTTPPPTTTTTTPPPPTTTTTPSPTTTTTTLSTTTTIPTPLPTTTTMPCPATVNQANVLYTYVGCYFDNWLRVLPHGEKVDGTCLTTETCKIHCHGMNYIYFGTEAGHQCFCGDVIKGWYMNKPDSECNAPCPGDRSTMCGGQWRISIYKIV